LGKGEKRREGGGKRGMGVEKGEVGRGGGGLRKGVAEGRESGRSGTESEGVWGSKSEESRREEVGVRRGGRGCRRL